MIKQTEILSVKDIHGNIYELGDEVTHAGRPKEETATIQSFFWDEDLAEIRAQTDKGSAGIDYITKI